MATEREMKSFQEEKLYGLMLLEAGWKENREMDYTFSVLISQAQSGMTAEEIDAVKHRVMQSIAIQSTK